MSQKYYCEFCGQRFHSPVAAIECARTPACRGLGFPPPAVAGTWKVRGCAIILATTAAELLQKSPAGKQVPRVREMGDNIIRWAKRAEEALCANTPLALGKRTRLHNGLVDFVWERVWKKGSPIPNIHALDLAQRYAIDAKEFVLERIEDGLDRHFWFQQEHPEWLLFDAVSMPLAVYVTCMKNRRMIDKDLDEAIIAWGGNSKEKMLRAGPPKQDLLERMLQHCWRDEVRNWNYLIGALGTAMRWIEKNGTAASLDLSHHDTDSAYGILLAYIWDDPVEKVKRPDLKLWLVDSRFWVAAETRRQAKEVLLRDSGHVGRKVSGIHPTKKLYGENGEVETAQEILDKLTKPQLYGVER